MGAMREEGPSTPSPPSPPPPPPSPVSRVSGTTRGPDLPPRYRGTGGLLDSRRVSLTSTRTPRPLTSVGFTSSGSLRDVTKSPGGRNRALGVQPRPSSSDRLATVTLLRAGTAPSFRPG